MSEPEMSRSAATTVSQLRSRRSMLRLAGLLAVGAAGTLLGCTTTANSPAAKSSGAAPTTVAPTKPAAAARGKYTFSGFDAPNAKLADASGIWTDAPYDHEFVQTSFPQSVAGLNSGALLVASYGISTALRQQADSQPQWTKETAPVKLIAGYRAVEEQYPIYPSSSILVRTDASINKLEDLRGKRTGFQSGGDVPTVYLEALRRAGVTRQDVQETTADSYGPLVAAFRTGEIQVLAASPSQVLDLIEAGQAKVFQTQDELGIAVFPGFATLSKTLQDPVLEPVVKDWLVRFTRFQQWKQENVAQVKDALIKVGQATEKDADFTIAQFRGTKSIAFDKVLIDSARRSGDNLHWGGMISNSVTDNIEATFDGRYNQATSAVTYRFFNFDKDRLDDILKRQREQAGR